MSRSLSLSIITPERVTYEQRVSSVTLPTASGEITVLPRHIPLVSVIKPGEVRAHTVDGSTVAFAVTKGVVEVTSQSEVFILSDDSEHADSINLEEAEAAYQRAQDHLEHKKDLADVDYARLQSLIEKNLTWMRVGKKYRR